MCRVNCDECKGNGTITCYNCGGRKLVYISSSNGGRDIPVKCPRCDGTGIIKCTRCGGKGTITDRY